jgi:rhodanese-related sulfurtransferase
VNDVKALYEKRSDWQMLDVREQWEWDAGHVEGSVHVPLADVMAGTGTNGLDQERPVAVICRSGNRSELGALILQARGFTAENVEGGLQAWFAAGLPVVTGSGAPGKVV